MCWVQDFTFLLARSFFPAGGRPEPEHIATYHIKPWSRISMLGAGDIASRLSLGEGISYILRLLAFLGRCFLGMSRMAAACREGRILFSLKISHKTLNSKKPLVLSPETPKLQTKMLLGVSLRSYSSGHPAVACRGACGPEELQPKPTGRQQ